MARLADIVLDCERPAFLARWWASTLDGYRVAPYDFAELERLRDMGVFDPEDDPMVVVEPALGDGPRYLFQRVPEPKRHKNRLHLDLRSEDLEAEVTRLGGHKSLYSDAYYDRETFDRLYGVANQLRVKQQTDPETRLTGLYEKAVNRR